MKNFYPAGDEQIMVCDVTGRTVPPSGIPLDVGAVVSNLATVYSIYNASQGQPFTEKYLTVTGAVNSPCIVRAPLGTSFAECLLLAGGSSLSSFHVIAGGPMMGKCYRKEEAAGLTVTKTTSGYIIVADDTPLVEKHNIPISVSLKPGQNVLYPMLLLHPDVSALPHGTSVKAAYDYAKARLCPVSRGGSGGRACQAGHDMQRVRTL